MTDVSTYHRQIATAVDRGEFLAPLELTAQMVDDATDVSALLDEFVAAIRAGRRDEARTIRRQLQRRLDEKQTADELLVKEANAALESGSLDEAARRELRETIQAAADTTQLRSGFLSVAGLYLSRLDQPADVDSLAGTSDALKDREQTLETARSEAETAVDRADLPPRLAFVGGTKRPTVDVDEPEPLTVVVRNVGDEPTDRVRVSVNPPDEVSANASRSSLSALAPDESEPIDLELDDVSPGEYTITVAVESSNAAETIRSLVVTAEDLGETDPVVRAFTGPDGTVSFDAVIQAIAHYNEGTTIPGSETKRLTREEVIWLLEEYNTPDRRGVNT